MGELTLLSCLFEQQNKLNFFIRNIVTVITLLLQISTAIEEMTTETEFFRGKMCKRVEWAVCQVTESSLFVSCIHLLGLNGRKKKKKKKTFLHVGYIYFLFSTFSQTLILPEKENMDMIQELLKSISSWLQRHV